MRNEKEVFNGDIGRVIGIEPDEQRLTVRHEDKVVTYDWSQLGELVLANAHFHSHTSDKR
jgi:exodeoxyribonuclease V alpha subunit